MPGNAGPARGRNPLRLTVLELLLQGHRGEWMPHWFESQEGADVRRGVSDLELMMEAARSWSTNLTLTSEERDRIREVWLEGTYRSPINLETGRRDELTGLLRRSVA